MLGPYPFDPNLVGQGIPIDARALPDSNIFGPIEGTPLPPGAVVPPAPGPLPALPPAPLTHSLDAVATFFEERRNGKAQALAALPPVQMAGEIITTAT